MQMMQARGSRLRADCDIVWLFADHPNGSAAYLFHRRVATTFLINYIAMNTLRPSLEHGCLTSRGPPCHSNRLNPSTTPQVVGDSPREDNPRGSDRNKRKLDYSDQ